MVFLPGFPKCHSLVFQDIRCDLFLLVWKLSDTLLNIGDNSTVRSLSKAHFYPHCQRLSGLSLGNLVPKTLLELFLITCPSISFILSS